jgi:hypothetical protein
MISVSVTNHRRSADLRHRGSDHVLQVDLLASRRLFEVVVRRPAVDVSDPAS